MDSINLKDLPLHCSDLSKLMFNIAKYPWGFLYHPAEWLNVASGINKVECFTIQFDDCMGMCSNAAEYDDKRDELLSLIITELTRFTFIWNALEVLLGEFVQSKVISKNSIKKIGKINAGCKFIKDRNIDITSIPYYCEVLRCLKCLLERSNNFADVFKGFSYNKEWISQSGQGLYTVYRIRNKFAHGSHSFPEPEDWSEKKPLDKNIIMSSSRILLLSMQMFLLAYYKNETTTIDCWWDHSIPNNEIGNREVEIKEYLREIHLEKEIVY
jgi:hypothetical protein